MIKPCPCCGAEARFGEYQEYDSEGFNKLYLVKCSRCGMSTEYYANHDEALEAWNDRVEEKKATTKTVIVKPVVYGKWIASGNFTKHRCSNCKGKTLFDYDPAYGYVTVFSHYCPWCGAKMDGDNDED